MSAVCRECGKDIVWGRTEKGRRMPIDPEPRADGNLAVCRDHLSVLRVRVITADGMAMQPYERPAMPHAATCTGKPGLAAITKPDGTVSIGAARRRKANAQRAVHGQ